MMIHSCQRQYTIGTVLICFLSTFFGVTVAQQKQVRFVDAPYQPISNEVIQTECPETSSCVPVYLCSIGRFASLNQPTSCQRKNNNQGICCPNSVNEQSVAAAASAPAINDAVHDPLNSRRSGARLSSAALHDAEITARSEMHNTRNLEQNIERRTDAYANDAEHTHSAFFGNNPIVNRLAHQGELLVHMSRSLSNRLAVNG